MVLKFHIQHDQTAGLPNDNIQLDRAPKMAAVSGNINPNKITFCSRTTWCIWLKFLIQHWWDLSRIIKLNKSFSRIRSHWRYFFCESSFVKMPICQETLNRFKSDSIKMIWKWRLLFFFFCFVFFFFSNMQMGSLRRYWN